jgi:predicted permease
MSIFSRWLRRSADDDLSTNRAEMEEEMRFHLDMAVERYMRSGLGAAEANRRATADFGGVRQQQESAADERSGAWWDILRQDLRFGARTLRRNIGFTTAVSVTMALGVAGAAAMFSVVYAVLLRPLPIEKPNQLVYVGWDYGGGKTITSLSPYEFEFIRRNGQGLTGITTFSSRDAQLAQGETTEQVTLTSIANDFFVVYARQPKLGRAFSRDEWRTKDSRVAIISDALWKRSFGGDEQVLSRTIRLNSADYRVVGIMPPGVTLPGAVPAPDVFVPFQLVADVRDEGHNYQAVVRLRSSTTPTTFRGELARLSRALRAEQPQLFDKPDAGFVPMSFNDVHTGGLAIRLWLLLAAVVCLLLVAAVNSANLWVARAVARQHEMVIRVAIGAGTRRVVRQLVTESLLVSIMSGAAGLVLGWWALRALVAHSPMRLPRGDEISFAPSVAVSILFLTAVAVIFGMFAALPARRVNVVSALGQRTASGSRTGARLRASLIVVETAFAVVLVSSAALLITSFYKLTSVDKGFATERTWAIRFARLPQAYDLPRRQAVASDFLERLRALPGVENAGALSNFPLERGMNFVVSPEGNPDGAEGAAEFRFVSPGAMEALSIRLRHGRLITRADLAEGVHVAVISESMARRFFGDANVIGRRIEIGRWRGEWVGGGYHGGTEVVGVVADVRDVALDKNPRLTLYLPQAPGESNPLRVVVSTRNDAFSSAQLAALVRAVDGSLAPPTVQPLSDLVGASVALQRYQTWLLGALGSTALLLAAVGIFGIMAYSVEQQLREIGVRIALGATPMTLVRLIVRRALGLVGAGSVLGVGLAIVASRLLQASLFNVSSTNPFVLGAAVGLLILSALAASFEPARRALRLQPIEVLRS